MAQTARDMYGNANAGNLAYDYSNPALHPDYTIEAPVAAPPQIETRQRAKAAPIARQIVSPGAVLGFAVAAVMSVYLLMSQIQLTTLSNETVILQERLNELKLEETRLRIAHESVFNFTEVEEYAIRELGMQKPRSDQVLYIDTSAPDTVVISKTEDGEIDGITEKIISWFNSIVEYFN